MPVLRCEAQSVGAPGVSCEAHWWGACEGGGQTKHEIMLFYIAKGNLLLQFLTRAANFGGQLSRELLWETP